MRILKQGLPPRPDEFTTRIECYSCGSELEVATADLHPAHYHSAEVLAVETPEPGVYATCPVCPALRIPADGGGQHVSAVKLRVTAPVAVIQAVHTRN